jgi:hypothetical protein
MTTILKQTSNIKNGLIGSTVSFTGNTTATSNPYITTTSGTAGQFLTSTGSNGTTWATSTAKTPYDAVLVANQNPASLEVKGRMVINGKDLEERLDTIEKVLQIPERDVILEKKHPKLKKLYDEYISALGKYRTFEAIKGDDDGTT